MIDVVCFCGNSYSFTGDAGACPECGEAVTFAGASGSEKATTFGELGQPSMSTRDEERREDMAA